MYKDVKKEENVKNELFLTIRCIVICLSSAICIYFVCNIFFKYSLELNKCELEKYKNESLEYRDKYLEIRSDYCSQQSNKNYNKYC